MIGEPPLLAGAFQLKVKVVPEAVSVRPDIAPGTVRGVAVTTVE